MQDASETTIVQPAFEDSVRYRLQQDKLYQQFLDEKCDAATIVSNSVSQGSVEDTLSKLTSGIARLETDISQAVGHHYDSLLKQVTTIHDLEKLLQQVRISVASLQASLVNVEEDITTPFIDIQARTIQLERMHMTCELLRKILRLLYLTQRLREHLKGGVTDLAKAAQSLFEIDIILKEADLNGIDVVQAEINFIKQARKDAFATAEQLFEKALEGRNQADLVVTLQAFHNFGKLTEKITSILDKYNHASKLIIKKALDMSGFVDETKSHGPGIALRIGGPQVAHSAAWKNALWSKVQSALQQIFNQYMQIRVMQTVLQKRKDSISQATFLDLYAKSGKKTPTEAYWNTMCTYWSEELSAISKGGLNYVDAAFIEDYPKLMQNAREMLKDLEGHGMLTGASASARSDEEKAFYKSFSRHQLGYLAQVTARLNEAASTVFSQSSFSEGISYNTLGSYAKVIYQELDVVRPIELMGTKAVLSRTVVSSDGGLALEVSKIVLKSIQLFLNKAEEKLGVDGAAYRFDDTVTPDQRRNASLYFAACALFNRIETLYSLAPQESTPSLQNGQRLLERFALDVLQRYFNHIFQHLQDALLMMHHPKTGLAPSDEACSAYMIEFRYRVRLIHQVTLPVFQTPSGMGSRPPLSQSLFSAALQSLRVDLLRNFIRSVCHLRDISEIHRMQLAADCAELPLCLQPFGAMLQTAGGSGIASGDHQWPQLIKQLHAVRTLLFVETAEIPRMMGVSASSQQEDQPQSQASSNTPGPIQSLGFALVITHILGRSGGEIAMPHQAKGKALREWMDWCDSNPESTVLETIAKSLELYAGRVAAEGRTQYHPVYPVVCDLVRAARK
eukprot:TRINITY_DN9902_c0_g1_i1.p1 TRINITY_DN9902_c0_g1~~TRINITY_DN9902_c0_g1_i1.p1  ORF type:complete len:849 (+),score=175.63 TRINITY_DN9902_c0_g1_i1:59-2605(+)